MEYSASTNEITAATRADNKDVTVLEQQAFDRFGGKRYMFQLGEIQGSFFNVADPKDWNTDAVAVRFFARPVLHNFKQRIECDNGEFPPGNVGTRLAQLVESHSPAREISPPDSEGFWHRKLLWKPQA